MTTLFFVFVILVVAHFILEGIIAPSERCKVRLNLFALRDEIRNRKIEYGNAFDDDLYEHMQAHTNKSIHLLHNYNIVGLFRAYRRKQHDARIAERMEHFYELLYASEVPGLAGIHLKSLLYTGKGLILNSAGWIIYLSPLLIAIAFLALLLFVTNAYRKGKEKCGKLLTALLELPENMFNRYFPAPPRSTI